MGEKIWLFKKINLSLRTEVIINIFLLMVAAILLIGFTISKINERHIIEEKVKNGEEMVQDFQAIIDLVGARLGASGSRDGSLFAKDCRLGNVRANERDAGGECLGHGHPEPKAKRAFISSFGPGEPIQESSVPLQATGEWHPPQYGRPRQLLRQRRGGEFL